MNKYKKIQLEMEHKSTPTYQEEIERQPRLGGSRNVLANKTKHLFLLTMKKTHCYDNFAPHLTGRSGRSRAAHHRLAAEEVEEEATNPPLPEPRIGRL